MSTQIEVIYKTWTIRFNEDDDTWSCYDLNIAGQKLSGVKRRIDEISKTARRVNVKALMCGRTRHDHAALKEVTVTVLCEPEPVPRHRGGDGVTPVTDECWIT